MSTTERIIPYDTRLNDIIKHVDVVLGPNREWPALRKYAAGDADPQIGLMDRRASHIDIHTKTKSYRWVITDEGRVFLWAYPDRNQVQGTEKRIFKGDLWRSDITLDEMKFEAVTDDCVWHTLTVYVESRTAVLKHAAKPTAKTELLLCH
jgi:hypothetical protein